MKFERFRVRNALRSGTALPSGHMDCLYENTQRPAIYADCIYGNKFEWIEWSPLGIHS